MQYEYEIKLYFSRVNLSGLQVMLLSTGALQTVPYADGLICDWDRESWTWFNFPDRRRLSPAVYDHYAYELMWTQFATFCDKIISHNAVQLVNKMADDLITQNRDEILIG